MDNKANEILQSFYGPKATFREGQLEAIRTIYNGDNLLLIQKTGWGKSIVYFIGAKLLREKTGGVTVIISPLLSLMRNQVEMATSNGVVALTMNSTNYEEHENIKAKLINDECDVLLISPERLSNNKFVENILPYINIGMLVIDEVHCISFWGNDFRLDYQRIKDVVALLPKHIPILGTTATANDNIINDIKKQLPNFRTQKGPLIRKSLNIQVIKLRKNSEKLAWLIDNLPLMEGTGIVYASTIAATRNISAFLNLNGINSLDYSGQSENREEIEYSFLKNKFKVIVATNALGMGFDKEDVGFVIHYHSPDSIASYYQQIGRAGRNLDNAFVVLLKGDEDDKIQEHFIETSLPKATEIQDVLDLFDEHLELRVKQIEMKLNMKRSIIQKCIDYLMITSAIYKEKSIYRRGLNKYVLDQEGFLRVKASKYKELEDINTFINIDTCYMRYISDSFDDPFAEDCGKCCNCIGEPIFNPIPSKKSLIASERYIRGAHQTIYPRKQFPIRYNDITRIKPELQNETGFALCYYNDSGYGEYVREDKEKNGSYREELVSETVLLINKMAIINNDTIIMYVPSLRRPNLVEEFAHKVGAKLNVEVRDSIVKTIDSPEQRFMQNSIRQFENVKDAYQVVDDTINERNIILIDDVCDSRWTLTYIGYELKQKGANKVYPYAIALATRSD